MSFFGNLWWLAKLKVLAKRFLNTCQTHICQKIYISCYFPNSTAFSKFGKCFEYVNIKSSRFCIILTSILTCVVSQDVTNSLLFQVVWRVLLIYQVRVPAKMAIVGNFLDSPDSKHLPSVSAILTQTHICQNSWHLLYSPNPPTIANGLFEKNVACLANFVAIMYILKIQIEMWNVFSFLERFFQKYYSILSLNWTFCMYECLIFKNFKLFEQVFVCQFVLLWLRILGEWFEAGVLTRLVISS